jgi:L-cysteine:1D-myo-inositol 2-amino-2-deoxy-alpha-D-glucopyranoside ligase
MKFFNTRSLQVEPFTPHRQPVTLYVCGITPYDTTHLGHAFTYTVADSLVRYLALQGHQVTYVQNVTDIDDDILRKAKEQDEDWLTLGNRWTLHFIEDMQALNVRPPDYYPRATEMMPQIIEMVQALLAAGVAYAAGGSVYFEVAAWPQYGQLSHLPQVEMLAVANERGNNPQDPHKRNPLDFVLWQAQATGEPAWDSPWGPGRPGWHIECSAMSTTLLGDIIDIHCGGSDLIFPHHESEIAQVEPLTGKSPFVRLWLHTAMVEHEGEKMSKSLGNLVMVRDLLQRYSADAIRLYLAAHHYRQPWSYHEADLRQAAALAKTLQQAVLARASGQRELDPTLLQTRFIQAMENDLNTPEAIAALASLAEQIELAAGQRQNVGQAQAALRAMGSVFGLRLDRADPEQNVQIGWRTHGQKFMR